MIQQNGKYYYLTKLAAECTAKRMVPDYISEKIMKELKIDKNGNGNCYPCMGCRSFLTPYVDENGNLKDRPYVEEGMSVTDNDTLKLYSREAQTALKTFLDNVAQLNDEYFTYIFK